MVVIKQNLQYMDEIANKEIIEIANHRDDGDIRALRLQQNKGKAKMFDFRTFTEICLKEGTSNCELCIAEDFFWTAQPFDVESIIEEDNDFDAFSSAVVASVWGTPAIIINGKMIACYKEIDMDDFPGVYFKDWPPELLLDEIQKNIDYMLEIVGGESL